MLLLAVFTLQNIELLRDLQRPKLLLNASGGQSRNGLDVSTPQGSELQLEEFTPQGPQLHLDVSGT